ncbi:hypothetical protein CRG98_025959 [Punica granatum]|uniref:RBR-type E3 ubiquitin transferase n=1 Tax=Punica granatum TaxID=22663 RepID=A0A2I0JBU1_PUNGR|nr:hypothetical protein CRG98_025959 [Punica granatum]
MPYCKQTFDPIGCQELVTREVFDWWLDLLCQSVVQGHDWCYCPNQDCQELIVNECGHSAVGKIECPSCRKSCCFPCGSPWNERNDHRCDNIFPVNGKNKWMRCPRCKYYVERIEGCNKILCRCRTRFCYRCGMKTNDGLFCSFSGIEGRVREEYHILATFDRLTLF